MVRSLLLPALGWGDLLATAAPDVEPRSECIRRRVPVAAQLSPACLLGSGAGADLPAPVRQHGRPALAA